MLRYRNNVSPEGIMSAMATERDGAIQAIRFFNNPERFPGEFPRH